MEGFFKMPKPLDIKDIGILMDMSLCMSAYLMGTLTTDFLQDTFFEAFRERMLSQGFDVDKVDYLVGCMKEIVIKLREL